MDHKKASTSRKLLLVEKNPSEASKLIEELQNHRPQSYEIDHVDHIDNAQAFLENHPDTLAVILPLNGFESKDFDSIQSFTRSNPQIAVILSVTDEPPGLDLKILKAGAQDHFCKKNLQIGFLDRIITQSIQRSKMMNLISEQKIALVSSSRLAQIGEMSGRIIHEINNPLTVILGYGEQLKVMAEEEKLNPEDLIMISERIIKTSERMSAIVKGLKTVIRDGSRDPFEPAPILGIIEEVLELGEKRFKQEEVRISVLQEDKSLTVDCRSVQISQVLLNLINNACDAIQKIHEKWIEIKVEEKETDIFIFITDCGPGIPKEIANQIFTPFYTTKKVGKGTGLGLSLCKDILKEHHGTISINTEYPNTQFVVRLPRQPPNELSKSPSKSDEGTENS